MSTTDMRAADEAALGPLSETVAQIMAGIRVVEALWIVPVALVIAEPPASMAWIVPVLAAFGVWAGVLAWVALARGLLAWLIAVDVTVTVAICLMHGRLVPVERISDGSGWVAVIASLCVVGLPLAWRVHRSLPAGLLVVAAFVAGFPIAGHPDLGRTHAVLMVGQLLASASIVGLVRRAAARAEAALTAAHEADQAAAVERAVRVDQSAQLRVVHDTALTTLTLVGTGSIPAWSDRLARRAVADLTAIEVLGSADERAGQDSRGEVPLEEVLTDVLRGHSGHLTVASSLRSFRVPRQVGVAFAGAVDEALRNVSRHAHVDRAELSLVADGDRVTVEVRDRGSGFDPEAVPSARFGVRHSILTRMESANGTAEVESAPGQGTRWILHWRPSSDTATATANALYARGALLGTMAVAFGWHLANSLPATIARWSLFPQPALALGLWIVFVLVGAVAAVQAVRDERRRIVVPVVGTFILLATVVIQLVVSPDSALNLGDWAWANFGWFAMLLLWRWPIGWLFAAMAVNVLAALTAMLLTRPMSDVDLARFAMVVFGAGSIEVGVAWGGRRLEAVARRANQATSDRAETLAMLAAAERVHADRQRRYREIGQAVRQLLADLAAGRVDTGDSEVQRRCAIEAARLRRLIAEHHDSPDPLMHELGACADMAERRGVVVSLHAVGEIPALSVPLRRAMTELPMHVLAAARTQARVTVTASPDNDEIEVSVVADADLDTARPTQPDGGETSPAGVEVTWTRDGEMLWVRTLCRP